MKIVEFTPKPQEPTPEVKTNSDTIAILTRLLEEAQSGHVREVAVAAILHDGRSSHRASSTVNLQALIGASTILTDRLLRMLRTVEL
jgi:hypothetical protein